MAAAVPAVAQQLPSPTGRPLEIDFADDPVLALQRQQAPLDSFRTIVALAVARNPALGEAVAGVDEAEAGIEEAEAIMLPNGEVSLTRYQVLTRDFSNDPENIIERSRPSERTDALASLQQILYDFGAGHDRIRGAGARLRAASAEIDASADRVALSAIAAWYDLFGYRALVALSAAYVDSLEDMRGEVQARIREGVSAETDIALADAYIARAQSRLAQFRRQLAGAEARFRAVTGVAPPASLERAPVPVRDISTRDEAILAAATNANVRSADAQAEAARHQANAARADRLPQLSASVDAGRYGVFENDRDYDVRARATIRYRLFGGTDAQGEQASARARGASARADRIRDEAERDAAVAWSDVRALEQQLTALRSTYIASRRARDAIAERFRAARGSLFDVVESEDSYFASATAFIQGLTELDAQRYVLLSRTGQLLDALSISPTSLGRDG